MPTKLSRTGFNSGAFFAALDQARHSRSLTWKQVAKEARVSASTLTRISQGRRPDVDSLSKLLAWAQLPSERFFHADSSKTPTLAMISTYLRGDKHLTAKSAEHLEAIIKTAYKALAKTGN